MDIDKLYLKYCGHNPEEVTWEFRNCMKYKIFHDAANIVIAEMKKQGGYCGRKMTKQEKNDFKKWILENGGDEGTLFHTFSDEELQRIFLTAYRRGGK